MIFSVVNLGRGFHALIHLLKHISVKGIKFVIVIIDFAVIVIVKVIVVPGEKLNLKVFCFFNKKKNEISSKMLNFEIFSMT